MMRPEAQVPGPGHVPTAKELAVELLKMIQSADFSHANEILAEDVVSEWPQSRERVRGLANLVKIFTNYPGGPIQQETSGAHFAEPPEPYLMTPLFTVVKAQGTGESATGSILTKYPDGSDWYIVLSVRARDGKIVYNEAFFAPVFDAPPWRDKWVEPMD